MAIPFICKPQKAASSSKLDSAVITNGTFTFKGTQDSAVNRYITCQPSGKEGVLMDFFLENGAITSN